MATKQKSLLTLPFRILYKIIFICYLPFYYVCTSIKKYIIKEPIDQMTGVEFEHYARLLLQQNGYTHVELTKASNDYGIDIVAMKGDVLYAIQCKKYSSKVGIDAIRQASTGCIYYDHDVAVVLTNSTFSSQAKTLALTLGVELWDEKTLASLIYHSYRAKYRKRKILCVFFGLSSLLGYLFYQNTLTIFSFYLTIALLSCLLLTICSIIFMKKDPD